MSDFKEIYKIKTKHSNFNIYADKNSIELGAEEDNLLDYHNHNTAIKLNKKQALEMADSIIKHFE